MVILAPQSFTPVYQHTTVGAPGPPVTTLPFILSILAAHSHPLPVWMDVSSLTPWLLDFHTVRFSGSSGYFLFLNLLLSFF